MKILSHIFTVLLTISLCLQLPIQAQEPAAKGWSAYWPVFAGIASIASTYLCYKIGYSFGKKRQENKQLKQQKIDQDLVDAIVSRDEFAARSALSQGARANQKITNQNNSGPTELFRIAAQNEMHDLCYDLFYKQKREQESSAR